MIPISIQTGGTVDLFGMEEGLKQIKEAGFDGVDLNLYFLLSYWDIRQKKVCAALEEDDFLAPFRPWKEAAEKWGLQIFQAHAPMPSCIYEGGEYNDYLIEMLKKVIAGCGYMGCRRLIVHPFFYGYEQQMESGEEWDLNIRCYSTLIETARQHDVLLCLENMYFSSRGKIYAAICSDMGQACRYVDTLNEIAGERRFAFCLDTGHLLLTGQDVKGAILRLGDRIEALHVHDNNGIADQHTAPYMGILDWERFIEGMREIGFSKPISFETSGAVNSFPREMAPDVLRLMANTARMFARRIEGEGM